MGNAKKWWNQCKVFQTNRKAGVAHLKGLYKERTVNIEEIVNITSVVPSFDGEEENELLMEEVSKEKLKVVFVPLQKDNIDFHRWTMEFFSSL